MKPVQVPAAGEIGGCSEQPKSYLEVQNSFEATVEQMQSIFSVPFQKLYEVIKEYVLFEYALE